MKQSLSLFFLKYSKDVFFPLHWEYTSNSSHLRSFVNRPSFICPHLCSTFFLLFLPQSDPATCQPPSPSPGSHTVKFYLRIFPRDSPFWIGKDSPVLLRSEFFFCVYVTGTPLQVLAKKPLIPYLKPLPKQFPISWLCFVSS